MFNGFVFKLFPILLLIFTGFTFFASPSMPNPSGNPLSLELDLEPTTLNLFLVNHSDQEQMYFYDQNLQPSHLIVFDRNHQPVTFFDTRSLKKFDNTPYQQLVRKIEPGQRSLLQFAFIRKKNDQIDLDWNPYQYHLKNHSGPFTISVEWKSSLDQVYDQFTKSLHSLPLWRGTLHSNTISL